MPCSDALHPWLVHSALTSLIVLVVGSAAVLLCRQPTRRVRIIELSLAGCLVAPWLGMIPGYPQLAGLWHAAAVESHEALLPTLAEQPRAQVDAAVALPPESARRMLRPTFSRCRSCPTMFETRPGKPTAMPAASTPRCAIAASSSRVETRSGKPIRCCPPRFRFVDRRVLRVGRGHRGRVVAGGSCRTGADRVDGAGRPRRTAASCSAESPGGAATACG